MTNLIVKASLLEEGLIDDVKKMIDENKTLFSDETVVLMADAHKGKDVPVGFTMTLSKNIVPPTFVSSDIGCGMTSYLLNDIVISNKDLKTFSMIAKDIIRVNKRLDAGSLTDYGTLGNGNHFVEIGTNGKDTLITVHSGSRSIGGMVFKKHYEEAKQQFQQKYHSVSKEELELIEPKKRQEYIKNKKKELIIEPIPYLDLNIYGLELYKKELNETIEAARINREKILRDVYTTLCSINKDYVTVRTLINTIHNYVEFLEDGTMILRKGSINAKEGLEVVIPINMKDGIILGISSNTENVNFSLPHGAGRVLSRTRAFAELDLETFKKDMEGIISPTVNQNTLDEAPRAYKRIETILNDITPFLSKYDVFKPIFNFKGE
jgi:RNA-splicing ligase RtcB